MRLLLVEDSVRLQQLLAETLNAAGYGVDSASSIDDCLSSVASMTYELVLIDLGLPDGDGLSVIRRMRTEGLAVPILVITARGSIDDRVIGLDSGADDYLIKPFNNAELLARVRALMRRPPDLQAPMLKKGFTEFNEATGEVRCSGERLDLRLSERRLFAALMRRSGAVVPKSTLEETLSQHGRE